MSTTDESTTDESTTDEIVMDESITDEGGAEPQLLTPGEVASLFRVNPKTVTRWAQAGRLTHVRTLGGHRRYPADEVDALLRALGRSGLALWPRVPASVRGSGKAPDS